MMPLAAAGRRTGAGAGRRHSAAGALPRGPGRGRRVLLRTAEGASPPTAGCGWRSCPPRPSSASGRSRPRGDGCRLARPVDRPRQRPSRPDLQHAGPRHALPARPAAAVDAGPGWSRLGRRALRGSRRRSSTAGPRPRSTPRRSSPSRPAILVVGTVDLDGVDAEAVSAVLRANGIVDTDSYRKLGRNQLRIGMFPAVEPDDVAQLTASCRLRGRHAHGGVTSAAHAVHVDPRRVRALVRAARRAPPHRRLRRRRRTSGPDPSAPAARALRRCAGSTPSTSTRACRSTSWPCTLVVGGAGGDLDRHQPPASPTGLLLADGGGPVRAGRVRRSAPRSPRCCSASGPMRPRPP